MKIREATIEDYTGMHAVRMSVKENVLNNPALITQCDYELMLTQKGKGWVCLMENRIVGFAIIDMSIQNIWALFVHPEFEKKGIGKRLFNRMIDWGFKQGIDSIWLSTSPGTRAEKFYTEAGWRITGMTNIQETRFEISIKEFLQVNSFK